MWAEIIDSISNVGFPIAMCVLMYLNNTKTVEVVNKNTEAINKLSEKVERLEERREV